MKKLFTLSVLAAMIAAYSAPVLADGCYMCSGGTFVKFSGSDNADKRKAAKACGCQIGGTRGSCSASNLKVLCSVENEQADDGMRLASCETEEVSTN